MRFGITKRHRRQLRVGYARRRLDEARRVRNGARSCACSGCRHAIVSGKADRYVAEAEARYELARGAR